MASKADGRLGGLADGPDHGYGEEGGGEEQQEEDQQGDLVLGAPLQYGLRWMESRYKRLLFFSK